MTHPESVLTALQVLELREQLEGKGDESNNGVDMEDDEKALLREMCNVINKYIYFVFIVLLTYLF